MNKEKRRVPKLRFPGFTEDWEQRKLDEVCNVYDGTHQTPRYTNSGVMFVSVEDIETLESNKYITEEDFKSEFKAFPEYGDILLTRIGDVGSANVILDEIKRAYYVSLALLKPKNINSLFLLALLGSSSVQSEIWRRTLHIAFPKKINKNEINKVIVKQPSIPEQEKIGKLFFSLDQTITLHQRKLEHLNLKKKALLQKLFPKNGERYSELRFPGFTDAWEQRKLNEFLSVSNFKNIDNKYNKNDVLSVSGDYGIVNQIEFQGRSFAGVSVSNYGVVETGDIVYTKSPLKLNPYGIIKANRINAGIVSTLYAIYKTKKNCDSKFIEHYFNLDSRLNKYLKPLVNKGAKNDMKVSSENALIGEVCFPHVTEQKLIADFLDRLDLFITLHQRKLEHLQLQKKALLQQMFV